MYRHRQLPYNPLFVIAVLGVALSFFAPAGLSAAGFSSPVGEKSGVGEDSNVGEDSPPTGQPTVTFDAIVHNRYGGDAVRGDFAGRLDGNYAPLDTVIPVSEGWHNIFHWWENPIGYELTDLTCLDTHSGMPIPRPLRYRFTFSAGEDVVCTMTFEEQATAIYLSAYVNNDDGGTLVADDVRIATSGGELLSPGTTLVRPGSIDLEVGAPGYTVRFLNCSNAPLVPGYVEDSISLFTGQYGSCLLLLDDVGDDAVVTIDVRVINDDGGLQDENDLDYRFGPISGRDGDAFSIPVGEYDMEVAVPDGFTATYFCSDDLTGERAPGFRVDVRSLRMSTTGTRHAASNSMMSQRP